MAANYQTLQVGKPKAGAVTWLSTTTANVKSDGTGTIGTDMLLAFTADSTYGGYINKVTITPQGSVASTPTTATVARIYIGSSSSGATTTSNTWLIAEVALASQTVDKPTAIVTQKTVDIARNIPAGWVILVSMAHAAATNTSWGFDVVGGDYSIVP